MPTIFLPVTALALVAVLLAACSDDPEPETARDTHQEQAGPGWFVVAEVEAVDRDSFLVYIEKPEDIEQADRIIAHRIPPQNVGARIVAGADGINRNTLGGGTAYHWHVDGFLGFGLQQPEVIDPHLDGSPTRIEGDVDGWIAFSSGMVVFPRYTVTARWVPAGNG